jgi:hypothetical protein
MIRPFAMRKNMLFVTKSIDLYWRKKMPIFMWTTIFANTFAMMECAKVADDEKQWHWGLKKSDCHLIK